MTPPRSLDWSAVQTALNHGRAGVAGTRETLARAPGLAHLHDQGSAMVRDFCTASGVDLDDPETVFVMMLTLTIYAQQVCGRCQQAGVDGSVGTMWSLTYDNFAGFLFEHLPEEVRG